MLNQKELRQQIEKVNKIATSQYQTSYCPVCQREYLLEDEREEIKKHGTCSVCQWFAKRREPHAIQQEDGQVCSNCGSYLEIETDGDTEVLEDGTHAFTSWPILYCPKCRRFIKEK